MTKEGSILRGFLTIAGAVIAAALADQVLMGYLPPWARSVLGLLGVAFLSYRGYIDSSHKDAQDAEKEALQDPIRNMADAAKDAVLDQGREEVERVAEERSGMAGKGQGKRCSAEV